MGNRFWIILRTYCLESSFVGPKYFYLYPDIVSRCFWGLNLVTSMMLSLYVTYLLHSRFNEVPTKITIENQFESMLNMPYPTITLCSPNQMTISAVKYFNRTLTESTFTIDLKNTLPQLRGFYDVLDDMNNDDLAQLGQILEDNRYTTLEIMAKIPQSCEKFLKKCFFEHAIYNCAELFQPIITSLGYCCAFNSQYYHDGKSITFNPYFMNRTMSDLGLPLALTVISDYEPEDVLEGTLENAGAVQVLLTDTSEMPDAYENVLVETNAQAYLFLRAKFTYCSDEAQLLPAWSRECFFPHEHSLSFFKDYHTSDCLLTCTANAVHQACGCVPIFIPNVPKSFTICNISSISCFINLKKNITSWLSDCDCPRNCESRHYTMDLSLGNFLGIPYMNYSTNPYRGMTFNESSSILVFLFGSRTYVKLKQETVMSLISLVSNLGGVFGLYLGCSGISILEIAFYVYQGIKSYVLTRGQRKFTIIVKPGFINTHYLD